MTNSATDPRPKGHLPRVVTPALLWAGGCMDIQLQGKTVHSHLSVFCVKGSQKTILIDTGHPIHGGVVPRDVEQFLDGRPLDYVFLTHSEFPHDGLAPYWLQRYPDAIAVGDLRDYRLYYPEFSSRIRIVKAGDRIDLGDREIIFVPAIWRDLSNTLWAFETKDRVLFVSDGFSYLHQHGEGECDLLTSEQAPPEMDLIRFFNEAALQWTQFTDVRVTFRDIDRLLRMLKPRMIAGAHGSLIDSIDAITPLIKSGMIVGPIFGQNATPDLAEADMVDRLGRPEAVTW